MEGFREYLKEYGVGSLSSLLNPKTDKRKPNLNKRFFSPTRPETPTSIKVKVKNLEVGMKNLKDSLRKGDWVKSDAHIGAIIRLGEGLYQSMDYMRALDIQYGKEKNGGIKL